MSNYESAILFCEIFQLILCFVQVYMSLDD